MKQDTLVFSALRDTGIHDMAELLELLLFYGMDLRLWIVYGSSKNTSHECLSLTDFLFNYFFLKYTLKKNLTREKEVV